MTLDRRAKVRPVPSQLLIRQCFRTGGKLARVGVDVTFLSKAVLYRHYLLLEPVRPEGAQDSPMVGHVPVPIRGPLPGDHGGEMRRLQGSHMPLIDRIIGDSQQADLAVAPGLGARPLDAEVKIAGLSRGEWVDISSRPAATAGIDSHTDVPIRHPFLRIGRLPILVLVGRTFGHIRVLGRHPPPLIGVPFLEGEAFCIGAVAQDHGILAFLRRTVNIRPKHQAIIHRDRNIPVYSHPVSNFTLLDHALSPISLFVGCLSLE